MKATPQSVGIDVQNHDGEVWISPNQKILIGTGLYLSDFVVPEGHFLAVCSRSGLANKGVFVLNAPGIIDPDYTDEIKVILTSIAEGPVQINLGDRIAQVIALKYNNMDAPVLSEERLGGFGSSGV